MNYITNPMELGKQSQKHTECSVLPWKRWVGKKRGGISHGPPTTHWPLAVEI